MFEPFDYEDKEWVWGPATNEVIDIAVDIRDKFHKNLLHARIGFVFRHKAPASGDKLTYGKASKVPDQYRILNEDWNYDGLIWLAYDMFKFMDPIQKRAMIDHELHHFDWDLEHDKLVMMHHDVEEFTDVIERYGLWSASLIELGQSLKKDKSLAMKQMEFIDPAKDVRGCIEAIRLKSGQYNTISFSMDGGKETTMTFETMDKLADSI